MISLSSNHVSSLPIDADVFDKMRVSLLNIDLHFTTNIPDFTLTHAGAPRENTTRGHPRASPTSHPLTHTAVRGFTMAMCAACDADVVVCGVGGGVG